MERSWLSMQQTGWSSLIPGSLSVKAILRYISVGLLLFLISENAFAADIHTVLRNLRAVIVPLTSMVLVISFVAGVIMIFKSLTLMKKFGMMQTMQSQPGEIGGPLAQLIVGTVLIYLPTSTDYLMNSLFDAGRSIFGTGINYSAMGQGSSILGYTSSGTFEQQWADLANTLVLYIQFIGFLSFVKGWFLLSKLGSQGAQPGSLARGLTHIVGGVIAINFVGFVNIIRNTILGT